ncbi:MAG: apolipoprotein N-acyltransferase, partial [Pseudonocardiaceae bacterium]
MAAPTVTAGDRPAPAPRTPRKPGRVLLRLGTALGAGLLLYVCAPPRELWWLAPVAFALLWLALHGPNSKRPGAASGFVVGLAFGLGFFVPLLPWIG